MYRCIPLSLFLSLVFTACWVDPEFPEYDLSETPFSNPYVERDEALLRVEAVDGFSCPDGSTPLIYFVTPSGAPSPRQSAAIFHGGNFDYVDFTGDHFETVNRLSGDWAKQQIHNVLGIGNSLNLQNDHGAWVAALLERGYRVAVPGNCWGDLWNGSGQGDYEAEGFLRLGSYLVTETLQRLQGSDDAPTERILAIGLAEGGRALTELDLAGVEIDGGVLDGCPDSLSPLVTGLSEDQAYTDGLLAIYDYDVRDADDEATRLDLLRAALERDSLADRINNRGYRTPLFYGYSSIDERIPLESTLPAADAILSRYSAGTYEIVDWEVFETAPSNQRLGRARTTLDWFESILPPLSTPTE